MAKKKHHSKPHYNKRQIMNLCTGVAREVRMAQGSSYTAMHILCLHLLLKELGFKQQRLSKVAEYVNKMEQDWLNYKIDEADMEKRLKEKAEWVVEYKEYQESDITSRKGSFDYMLDKRQLEPQNLINRIATRHLNEFFLAMVDLHGYGKERLERLETALHKSIEEYQYNKRMVVEMRKDLADEGILIEDPIDPLTGKHTISCMAGTMV